MLPPNFYFLTGFPPTRASAHFGWVEIYACGAGWVENQASWFPLMPVGGSVLLRSFWASTCGRAKIRTQSLTRRGIRRSPRPFFSSLGSLNVVCWIMLECCHEPKIALISVLLYVNDVCALWSPLVLSSCYFFCVVDLCCSSYVPELSGSLSSVQTNKNPPKISEGLHCSEEGEILIDWRIINWC